ncbi:MAG: 2-hydroxyacid dehydrogenase, partial [Acidimicrobiales bacterium]
RSITPTTDVGRVLVTRQVPSEGLQPLTSEGHEVVQRSDDVPYTHAELVASAKDVQAIVCLLTDRIDASVLAAGAGTGLRAVGNVAVGYDNIDLEAAALLGVAVCNTPGVLDESVADLAFGLILSAARIASEAERDLRAGSWPGWGINQYLGRDVHSAVLGLVGYGRISQAVARRAAGFSMKVLHHSRRDTSEDGYVGNLDSLLGQSDIVSIHVPLTDGTFHLIGARELALMREDSVLVNTSRGPVVDELALAEALETGAIFAAGIDVYEHEPQVHPRLLAAPRAVLLPHIGSATRATRARMTSVACEGVCDVLAGRHPANLVTGHA